MNAFHSLPQQTSGEIPLPVLDRHTLVDRYFSLPDELLTPERAGYVGAGVLIGSAIVLGVGALRNRKDTTTDDLGGIESTQQRLLEVSTNEAAQSRPSFLKKYSAPIVGATGLTLGVAGMAAQPVNVIQPPSVSVDITNDIEIPNPNATHTVVIDLTDGMTYTEDIYDEVTGQFVPRAQAVADAMQSAAQTLSAVGSVGSIRVIGVAGEGTAVTLFDGDFEQLSDSGLDVTNVVPTDEEIADGIDQAITLESSETANPNDTSARRVTLFTDGNVSAAGVDLNATGDVAVDEVLVGTPDGTYQILEFSEPRESGISSEALNLDPNNLEIADTTAELEQRFVDAFVDSSVTNVSRSRQLEFTRPETKQDNLLPITAASGLVTISLLMMMQRLRKLVPNRNKVEKA